MKSFVVAILKDITTKFIVYFFTINDMLSQNILAKKLENESILALCPLKLIIYIAKQKIKF